MKSIKQNFLIASLFVLKIGWLSANSASTNTIVNPCQPNATIVPIASTYGCSSFKATNNAPSGSLGNYSWNFGDGTTAVGDSIYHCYYPVPAATNSTNYTVTVTYTSLAQCGPQLSQSKYTVTINPPQNICVRNKPYYTLTGNKVGVGPEFATVEITFSYNFGDNTGASHIREHTYARCGNYIIEMKDWNMNTPTQICYSYLAINLKCPKPNLTSTGENKPEDAKLVLFPNPALEKITLKAQKSLTSIKILDIMGREMFLQKEINSDQTEVNVSELPAGTYFLSCLDETGLQTSRKFFKE